MTDTAHRSRTYIEITEANTEELIGKRLRAHIILAAYADIPGQFVDSAGTTPEIIIMTATFLKAAIAQFKSDKERDFA